MYSNTIVQSPPPRPFSVCLFLMPPRGYGLLYALSGAGLLYGSLEGLLGHDDIVELVLGDDVDCVCICVCQGPVYVEARTSGAQMPMTRPKMAKPVMVFLIR
jgi:hypothetical protein